MSPRTQRTLAERLVEAGWLAILLLLPLAFNPWGRSIFSLPKAVLFRALVAAMLAAWAYGRLFRSRVSGPSLTRSPLAAPAAALLVVIVGASALAQDRLLSFWGSYGRVEGALTLACMPVLAVLVATTLPGVTAARRVFWVATAPLLPLAAYAALQLRGPDPLGIVTDARSPVFATLGRSNFLGSYVAMLLPLAMTLYLSAERRLFKAAAVALGILAATLLLASQARAAWLAALVAVAVWAGLVVRRRLVGATQDALVRSVIASLAAVLTAAALWIAHLGGSGAARLATWQGVQKLIFARPLLGYGPDSLGLVFPRVYPPELVYYQGRELVVDRAHNLVLDWMVSLGTLGLFAGAACLLVVLGSARCTLTATRATGARQLLVIGALAAIVGNLAGNLVSFDIVSTMALATILAGLVVALEPHREGLRDTVPEEAPRRWWSGNAARLVAVAALGLLVIAIGVSGSRLLAADVLARRVDQLAAQGDWAAAAETAQRAVAQFPFEPMYRQQLGWSHLQAAMAGGPDAQEHLAAAERALQETNRQRPDDFLILRALAEFHEAAAVRFDRRHLAKADAAWEAATTVAPNHATLYSEWGRFRLQSGDPAAAIPLLRKAVDLDSTDTQAWMLLADHELQQQRSTSAVVMYRQALKHAPERPEPLLGLAAAYWQLGQPQAARTALSEALQLDPQNATALALQNEFERARTEVQPDVEPEASE